MDESIYIFGAHSRAQTLAVYLLELHPNLRIEAFLYDNEEKNPSQIGAVPVIFLNEETALHVEYPVYIGTRGTYHPAIAEKLKNAGFGRVFPVTVELDLKLRNRFLEKYCAETGRRFLKIDGLKCNAGNGERFGQGKDLEARAGIYVARSVHDKPLCQFSALSPYEREIQVGAALTKERRAEDILTDDKGDNISEKNRQFCELTALYWIWKNAAEDIVGLEHYRRHFILPSDWAARMLHNKVDVILPVPLYAAPSLEENFKNRHEAPDWDYMMEYLKKNCAPEYFAAEDFFKGNLYSPCNMFIMRREVLDDLCKWLFPILFAVAEHGGEKEDAYQNRYPGFLSERLISFFFEKHLDVYKVVYADKNFLC